MIENYEITSTSNTRTIAITFPGGLDVVMPAPYSGRIFTYRVFDILATYADDLPPEWSASVGKVFKSSTPPRATIVLRAYSFEPQIRENFTKLVESLDIRDERERGVS